MTRVVTWRDHKRENHEHCGQKLVAWITTGVRDVSSNCNCATLQMYAEDTSEEDIPVPFSLQEDTAISGEVLSEGPT
jgi:hypothetical protein